jgi:hypothetical protein
MDAQDLRGNETDLRIIPAKAGISVLHNIAGTGSRSRRKQESFQGSAWTASDHQSDRMLNEMPECREQLRAQGAVYDAVIA